jgi:hypothetical protein
MNVIVTQKLTKKERAVELYEKNHALSLDKLIRAFVRELDLPSENSARTYISLSKKALASRLNMAYKGRKIDARTTKRGKAMELFNRNINISRKEMIDLFVNELNMSYNSAATHCSQCAQEYHGPKHNAIV